MDGPEELLRRNRAWAEATTAADAGAFARLAAQQAPAFLWIGCADSRVPANVITGLEPGEVFVHRNVANLVPHSDLNALTVLEYAVSVLHVRHVIVCGHYGCGGVEAALDGKPHGLADNWLRHIKDVAAKHADDLEAQASGGARARKLCELNAIEQAHNVCHATVVQRAWARGEALSVRAWIYDLTDGLLRDLGFVAEDATSVAPAYRLTMAGEPSA
ncbi:MAG: carbonate dehydratase [Deinococcales bacterium]|jgi:carbonic anhydrase